MNINFVSLNPSIFMDNLKQYGKDEKEPDCQAQTVWAFSEDIGMDFRIHKCAVLVMKIGVEIT